MKTGTKIGRVFLGIIVVAVTLGACRKTPEVQAVVAKNDGKFEEALQAVAVVMRKHGFTDEQIDNAAKAYRHVYQTGTSVFNALKRIEADVDPGNVRDIITAFIRGCNLRLVGIPRDLE